MVTSLSKILRKDYVDILKSSEFHDTEILVGKEPNTKIFKLHSLILKIRSNYFRAALSSNWVKKENNIIKLNKPNISIRIFNIIIEYIYSGIVELSNNDFETNVELLVAADELNLEDLCNFIEDGFVNDKKLLKRNFISFQNFTTKFTQFKKSSNFCKEAFKNNPSLIFSKDFINIKEDKLLEIFKKHKDSFETIRMWNKLVEWCIAQSSVSSSDVTKWNSHEILIFGNLIRPFIPLINFKKIDSSNFFHKVKPFKDIIFDIDFYVKILEYYSFGDRRAYESSSSSSSSSSPTLKMKKRKKQKTFSSSDELLV